jgi:hypothetical protein
MACHAQCAAVLTQSLLAVELQHYLHSYTHTILPVSAYPAMIVCFHVMTCRSNSFSRTLPESTQGYPSVRQPQQCTASPRKGSGAAPALQSCQNRSTLSWTGVTLLGTMSGGWWCPCSRELAAVYFTQALAGILAPEVLLRLQCSARSVSMCKERVMYAGLSHMYQHASLLCTRESIDTTPTLMLFALPFMSCAQHGVQALCHGLSSPRH